LQVVIEKAVAADIPALSDLLTLLFTQEAELTPNAQAQRSGLAQIIGDPDVGTVLLARHEGQVVGMVNLLFTVSTALGARVVMLEDMIVSPEARGKGVGARLLAAAVSYARAEGFKRITLLTDRSNEIAQAFYGTQGFEASAMVPMRLVLE
jgi:GNAT superfamily N-acetyltransferase